MYILLHYICLTLGVITYFLLKKRMIQGRNMALICQLIHKIATKKEKLS